NPRSSHRGRAPRHDTIHGSRTVARRSGHRAYRRLGSRRDALGTPDPAAPLRRGFGLDRPGARAGRGIGAAAEIFGHGSGGSGGRMPQSDAEGPGQTLRLGAGPRRRSEALVAARAGAGTAGLGVAPAEVVDPPEPGLGRGHDASDG